MKTVTVPELITEVATLIKAGLKQTVMIWGPPGVGKSSAVFQIGLMLGLKVVDVRLGQLAPTDLRGLPKAAEKIFGIFVGDELDERVQLALDGKLEADEVAALHADSRLITDLTSLFAAPDFLPRGGQGILFLDEITQAAPSMQAMSQQLILDRRVGSYELPDGWALLAGGNRRQDRTSVHDMPMAVANRMLHYTVEPDVDAWITHASQQEWSDPMVQAFLRAHRDMLLQLGNSETPAWPSPRSWEAASRLRRLGLDTSPAVGQEAAVKLEGYAKIEESLPDLEAIIEGREAVMPDDMEARWATAVALNSMIREPGHWFNSLRFFMDEPEFMQMMIVHRSAILRQMEENRKEVNAWYDIPDDLISVWGKDYEERARL